MYGVFSSHNRTASTRSDRASASFQIERPRASWIVRTVNPVHKNLVLGSLRVYVEQLEVGWSVPFVQQETERRILEAARVFQAPRAQDDVVDAHSPGIVQHRLIRRVRKINVA